jgi:hypothetical protein
MPEIAVQDHDAPGRHTQHCLFGEIIIADLVSS